MMGNQWGDNQAFSWGHWSEKRWFNFKLSLAETEISMLVQGIKLTSSNILNSIASEICLQGITVEHSKVQVVTEIEMVTSLVFSTRDYLHHMLKYLPLYERKSVVYQAILKSVDREFRRAEQAKSSIDLNLLISSAIECIGLYERDLGIKEIADLKYDQRREQISARMRAIFDQTTLKTIKEVASTFTNGEVVIYCTEIPGIYECEFVDIIGIPNNMSGLQGTVDLLMPAHLQMTYKYKFQVWVNWNRNRWSRVNGITWEKLRMNSEV